MASSRILAASLQPEYLEPTSPRNVNFTAQQLQYLETVFPEMLDSNASDAALRHRVGQRAVIAHIRTKVAT